MLSHWLRKLDSGSGSSASSLSPLSAPLQPAGHQLLPLCRPVRAGHAPGLAVIEGGVGRCRPLQQQGAVGAVGGWSRARARRPIISAVARRWAVEDNKIWLSCISTVVGSNASSSTDTGTFHASSSVARLAVKPYSGVLGAHQQAGAVTTQLDGVLAVHFSDFELAGVTLGHHEIRPQDLQADGHVLAGGDDGLDGVAEVLARLQARQACRSPKKP